MAQNRGVYACDAEHTRGMTFLFASSSPLVHPLLDSPRKILQSTVDVHVRDGERNDAAMNEGT